MILTTKNFDKNPTVKLIDENTYLYQNEDGSYLKMELLEEDEKFVITEKLDPFIKIVGEKIISSSSGSSFCAKGIKFYYTKGQSVPIEGFFYGHEFDNYEIIVNDQNLFNKMIKEDVFNFIY